MTKRNIRKIAVLGSGVMGTRIACHFANIGAEVLLLDIVPKEGNDRNKIVNDALAAALKSNPSPIYDKRFAKRIKTGNFEDDLAKIKVCDWIIEVVIERLDIKNKFQDPDKFLKAGGFRGRQLQVLVEGTYFVNRLFATVEMIQKTVIEVGNVGVVVSYTGATGEDLSGKEYRHGELVARGQRGVWEEALLPGKYAYNTYAGKVVAVPTTNFILKWISNQTGAHKFDENLSEVSLITKDAFEPSLPLSVVVHIDYAKSPAGRTALR